MAQKMKEWRTRARLKLILAMGGKCVDCKQDDPAELTFDHIVPLSDEQATYRQRIGANSRMVMNRKEAAEGLITLRCYVCQRKKNCEPKQGSLEFVHAGRDVPF